MKEPSVHNLIAGTLGLVMGIASAVSGLFVFLQVNPHDDQLRESAAQEAKFTTLKARVQDFWRKNGRIPASLTDCGVLERERRGLDYWVLNQVYELDGTPVLLAQPDDWWNEWAYVSFDCAANDEVCVWCGRHRSLDECLSATGIRPVR